MIVIAAFVLSPVVLLLGFFLGSMMSSTRISDLEDRCSWLTEMLRDQEIFIADLDDDLDDDLVWRFQQQVEDRDSRDDL